VPTIFKLAKVPKGPDVIHVDVAAKRVGGEYKYPKEGIYTANELTSRSGTRSCSP